MNTEQAKQLSEAALHRLMTALEKGQSAVLKQYLAVMCRFRRYSWANTLLIYSQFPQATRRRIQNAKHTKSIQSREYRNLPRTAAPEGASSLPRAPSFFANS